MHELAGRDRAGRLRHTIDSDGWRRQFDGALLGIYGEFFACLDEVSSPVGEEVGAEAAPTTGSE